MCKIRLTTQFTALDNSIQARILLTAEALTLRTEITEHMEEADLEVKQALLNRITISVPSDFLETLIAPLPAAEPF
jgi:hypothetical protein